MKRFPLTEGEVKEICRNIVALDDLATRVLEEGTSNFLGFYSPIKEGEAGLIRLLQNSKTYEDKEEP